MGNPRYANGHRARQLRARILATEDTCALCGKPVDKTLDKSDPWAPHIDHIIPVSRGGAVYARQNGQLSHRLCNQRKGNKQTFEIKVVADLLTSRNW